MLSLYGFPSTIPSLSLSKFICMSSSSLPLSFNNPLIHRPQSPSCPSDLNFTQFPLIAKPLPRSLHNSLICFTFSSSNNSNYEREEARWLREEQRWLREEQRWNAEREKLVREISALKLRIQELERQGNIQGGLGADTVANIAALLQVLKAEGDLGKKVNQIAESGSSAAPLVVETTAEMAEEVVVKEVVEASDGKSKEGMKAVKKRVTLRKGAEGEDVRAMQESLQKLGFYSGEEDVEYSSFSTGTERVVKTWQATLGVPEDGIMTAELLEKLYAEQTIGDVGLTVNADPKGNNLTFLQTGANGAAIASGTEVSEIKETTVTEEGVEEVEEYEHKVFLLGENRWEDPSRLSARKKKVGDATIKCLSCRGEGRLLCTECDGTGEPNIEEQFMDWVEEGTKCPYCEGLGYTLCNLCEGKMVIKA